MDGRVTFWSAGMEQRYGFAAEDAVGQVSHQLLRTSTWETLNEIQAALLARNTWSGGLIHHRADGRPVMAANLWHMHRDTSDEALVSEVHVDIVTAGTASAQEIGDVMSTLAHELSEPLTALCGYFAGLQRGVRRGWPDRALLEQGVSSAGVQLSRARSIIEHVRALGENLRDPALREAHARLTSNLQRTERSARRWRELSEESRALQAENLLTRHGRQAARELQRAATGTERATVLRNIRLFRDLLQPQRYDPLEPRTEQAIRQVLEEEEARLAALGPEGSFGTAEG